MGYKIKSRRKVIELKKGDLFVNNGQVIMLIHDIHDDCLNSFIISQKEWKRIKKECMLKYGVYGQGVFIYDAYEFMFEKYIKE